MDKSKAIIDYLLTCPSIYESPLFFNFANSKDESKQLVINSSDTRTNKSYIDGSVLRNFIFTIIDYRSVSYQPLVKQPGYSNENVEEMLDVQSVIEWITEQNELGNYPDFGEDCIVDEISVMSNTPNLNGVDSQSTPNLAKYSIVIKVVYLDRSKVLFT